MQTPRDNLPRKAQDTQPSSPNASALHVLLKLNLKAITPLHTEQRTHDNIWSTHLSRQCSSSIQDTDHYVLLNCRRWIISMSATQKNNTSDYLLTIRIYWPCPSNCRRLWAQSFHRRQRNILMKRTVNVSLLEVERTVQSHITVQTCF